MADGALYRIPTDPHVPHPLGRSIVVHDPRNRQHRALAGAAPLPDRSSGWYSPDVFDQRGSSCTMQATVGTLRSSSFRATFAPHWPLYDTETERHAAYLASQAFDPWDGAEPSYEGTSSDAPWRLLRDLGQIAGWKWLFGLDEARQYAMHHGVFCTGTIWRGSMFDVTPAGYIDYRSTSPEAGGHEWRIVGYSVARRAFRMVNSWGRGWGQSGRAWIREEHYAELLANDGDCVTRA